MKKATGVTRKVDELGRVVLPIELRRTLGIVEGTPMEIFVEEENIVLRKYAPGCYLCGQADEELTKHERSGKLICRPCREGK